MRFVIDMPERTTTPERLALVAKEIETDLLRAGWNALVSPTGGSDPRIDVLSIESWINATDAVMEFAARLTQERRIMRSVMTTKYHRKTGQPAEVVVVSEAVEGLAR